MKQCPICKKKFPVLHGVAVFDGELPKPICHVLAVLVLCDKCLHKFELFLNNDLEEIITGGERRKKE